MPQTLHSWHCVILYSENFHHDDQKAAKKAGIESLAIANFHYTDKIKAVDIRSTRRRTMTRASRSPRLQLEATEGHRSRKRSRRPEAGRDRDDL